MASLVSLLIVAGIWIGVGLWYGAKNPPDMAWPEWTR